MLNGIAEQRGISRATIERVQDAARRFNCIPNQSARRLKSQRSEMIGVIVGNFKLDWAEAVMEGLQSVLDPTPYVPFVATHRFDIERNRKELLSSLRRRDDGLITFPTGGCEDLYRLIRSTGTPIVLIADELTELADEVSSVTWNASAAIERAVAHLCDLGRRRIAFLGIDLPGESTRHRFDCFQSAIAARSLDLPARWIARPPASNVPDAIIRAALDQFFDSPGPRPDAVLALNDGLAIPALEELEKRGYRVPEDIALIGMGNLPLTHHPAISITTLPEPVEQMGALAARVLLDHIEKKTTTPVRREVATDELIIRRTTVGGQ